MHKAFVFSAAGFAETDTSIEGVLPFFGFLIVLVGVGVVVYLVLQRTAEILTGVRRTTIRELILCTFLIATLFGLLEFIRRIEAD